MKIHQVPPCKCIYICIWSIWTLTRHSGQDACLRSQLSMHRTWNTCWHWGRALTNCCTPKSWYINLPWHQYKTMSWYSLCIKKADGMQHVEITLTWRQTEQQLLSVSWSQLLAALNLIFGILSIKSLDMPPVLPVSKRSLLSMNGVLSRLICMAQINGSNLVLA